MSANLSALLYLAAGVLFILSLRGLSSPATSRRGNLLGMIGMAIAVGTTLASHPPADGTAWLLVLVAVAIGGSIGAFIARRVPMTSMPELVAAFHSLVGMAAVLVAAGAFYAPEAFGIGTPGHIHSQSLVEMSLGVAIGALTFTGSVIAFLKLSARMSGKPIILPARHFINIVLAVALVVSIVSLVLTGNEVYFWLNTALALLPVVKWAGEEVKREMLPLFAGDAPVMAGLAATEPGAGSALSAMTTTFEEVEGGYRIRGRKHWQALSSSAHWWLVLAKNAQRREYGYFVVERSEGFRTVELYEALGLKLLDYGVNDIDVIVPRHRRIDAEEAGLDSVDVFLASRALLAAAGAGFLRRISREAHTYVDGRQIGRKPQSKIGFVNYRLAAIDTSATICEALVSIAWAGTGALLAAGSIIAFVPAVLAGLILLLAWALSPRRHSA